MDFAGIYVFGYDRPFNLAENLLPLQSFRDFSDKDWPIYLFYAVAGEVEEAVKKFGNVIPIQIKPMLSINDYDNFMMRECFHLVKHELTLTMHQDGYLLKKGWEEFTDGYDYLGASWIRHIPNFDFHYKENNFSKFEGYKNIRTTTTVGNGGFCFRKTSKMLEVENSVNWCSRVGGWLPDDVFYSFYGFGQGIFKPVSVGVADLWSQEPFCGRDTYGFHGVNTVRHCKSP